MPSREPLPLHAVEHPAATSPARGTIVMLHGYGSHEGDLLSLGAELDPALRTISLRAPLALPWGGHAWYALRPHALGIDADQGEVELASAQAARAIEAIARQDGRAPILCGFSQGGGVAISVALERPALASAVIALSAAPSRLPPARRAPKEQLKALPVFAAHGTRDELLPILLGRQTRAFLEESGCLLEWHEYPMGHEVSRAELDDLRAFLAKCG